MSKDLFPINISKLKKQLRNGLDIEFVNDDNIRSILWPLLSDDTSSKISDLSTCPNLDEMSNRLLLLTINKNQINKSDNDLKILIEILNKSNLSNPKLLIPLLKSICKNNFNLAINNLILFNLIEIPSKFINTNSKEHKIQLLVFKNLLKGYMPKTFVKFNDIGGLDDEYLDLIFIQFFKSLLPIILINRIIDSYLFEGSKILFRYGLALIRCYKYEIKQNKFKSGKNFWNHIQEQSKQINNNNNKEENIWYKNMLSNIQYFAFEKPLNHRRMKISRENISILTISSRMELDANGEFNKPIESNSLLVSSINLAAQSNILNSYSSLKLLSFLPLRLQPEGSLEKIFTATNDGWNISTLYSKSKMKYPIILLLHTVQSSENIVIGMYLNSKISPPSNNVRGNGESFCFLLTSEEINTQSKYKSIKYNWINLNENEENTSSCVNQFAVCSSNFLQFGGSEKYNSNAIYISENLHSCMTSYSDTYNNPPLLLNKNDNTDTEVKFEINELEVFTRTSTRHVRQ
jgi:hypothetical protein